MRLQVYHTVFCHTIIHQSILYRTLFEDRLVFKDALGHLPPKADDQPGGIPPQACSEGAFGNFAATSPNSPVPRVTVGSWVPMNTGIA